MKKEISLTTEELLLDISGSPNMKLLIFSPLCRMEVSKMCPCKDGSVSHAYLRANRGERLDSQWWGTEGKGYFSDWNERAISGLEKYLEESFPLCEGRAQNYAKGLRTTIKEGG